MIGLHFMNAQDLDLYLGEFSITRGTTSTPSAPEITSMSKTLGNHYKVLMPR